MGFKHYHGLRRHDPIHRNNESFMFPSAREEHESFSARIAQCMLINLLRYFMVL